MNLIINISIFIFSFLFIFSTEVYSSLTSEYFPLAVGNSWTLKNTVTGKISTSNIVGTQIINGQEAYRGRLMEKQCY